MYGVGPWSPRLQHSSKLTRITYIVQFPISWWPVWYTQNATVRQGKMGNRHRKETIERMTEVCNHANDYYSSHTVSYIGCTGWEYNLSVILPFGLGGSLWILGTAYKVVGRARNWRQYAMIKERLSSPWTIEIIVWQHSSVAEKVSRVVKEKVLRSCID